MSATNPPEAEQSSGTDARQTRVATLTVLERCEFLDRVMKILHGLERHERGTTIGSLRWPLEKLKRDAEALRQANDSPDVQLYSKAMVIIEPTAASGDYGKAAEIAREVRHKLVYRLPVLESDASFRGSHLAEPADTPQKDGPDERGYVETPTDPRAYVRAVDIVNVYTPPEVPVTVKQLSVIAEDYANNRIRWTRPKDKKGNPIKNRRRIHLGDWADYVKRRTATDPDGFPRLSDGEIQARTEAVRQTKQRGK